MNIIMFDDESEDINAIGFCCKKMWEKYKKNYIKIVLAMDSDGKSIGPGIMYVTTRMSNGDNYFTTEIKYCPHCGQEITIKTAEEVADEA